jgi:hypothetical protein
VEKGLGDIARGAVAGVKGAFQGAKQGIQDARKPGDPSKRIGGREETTPVTPAKPKPRGQAGVDPSVTIRPGDAAAQAKFKNIRSQVNRDIAKPSENVSPSYSQGSKRWQDASPDDDTQQRYM